MTVVSMGTTDSAPLCWGEEGGGAPTTLVSTPTSDTDHLVLLYRFLCWYCRCTSRLAQVSKLKLHSTHRLLLAVTGLTPVSMFLLISLHLFSIIILLLVLVRVSAIVGDVNHCQFVGDHSPSLMTVVSH